MSQPARYYRKLKNPKNLNAQVEIETYQVIEHIATEKGMSLGAALDWIAKKLSAKSATTT